jgi:DNA-binding CsgD family transcriptional regulator
VTLRGTRLGQPLSPREREVHALFKGGMRPYLIQRHLNLSRGTVCEYLTRIREKLGITTPRLPKKKITKYRRAIHKWRREYFRSVFVAANWNTRRAAQLAGVHERFLYDVRRRLRATPNMNSAHT